jgi:hypothetical protein
MDSAQRAVDTSGPRNLNRLVTSFAKASRCTASGSTIEMLASG